jgi:hypothetical protein
VTQLNPLPASSRALVLAHPLDDRRNRDCPVSAQSSDRQNRIRHACGSSPSGAADAARRTHTRRSRERHPHVQRNGSPRLGIKQTRAIVRGRAAPNPHGARRNALGRLGYREQLTEVRLLDAPERTMHSAVRAHRITISPETPAFLKQSSSKRARGTSTGPPATASCHTHQLA